MCFITRACGTLTEWIVEYNENYRGARRQRGICYARHLRLPFRCQAGADREQATYEKHNYFFIF